jgi:FHIPEP family protein/conflict system STAND superfamily ATPase
MTREELFETLDRLNEAQLSRVIFFAHVPGKDLSPHTVAQTTRVIEIVAWAEQAEANREALLRALRRQGILPEAREAPLDQALLPSRAPIVIAIEDSDHPLEEKHLLHTERHLLVTLDSGEVDALERLGSDMLAAGTIQAILDSGRAAWAILQRAEDRLNDLLNSIDASQESAHPFPQPVAWTGHIDLLCRIFRAVLAMHRMPEKGAPALVSAQWGHHYFHPLHLSGASRSMAKRRDHSWTSKVEVKTLELARTRDAEADNVQAIDMATSAEVVLLRAEELDGLLRTLAERVEPSKDSVTRLAIGFGAVATSPDLIAKVLATIPCVSIGGPRLAEDGLIKAIHALTTNHLQHQAVPTALSPLRKAALQDAERHGDVARFRDALFWTTWSWVGRPLFASEFGEMIRACYASLLDLRTVADRTWYFNRETGIPDKYQARALLEPLKDPPDDSKPRFHLYLTGAGGTGKSCFLRNLYNTLTVNEPSVLPVWYKVDAPSSEWKEVEERIKEETIKALEQRLGKDAAAPIFEKQRDLGPFLNGIRDNLKTSNPPIKELCLFVDQLERTFELGDNPDLGRLTTISRRFIDLLKAVGVSKGIRIFIASRKQYLPDFLSSFEMAEAYKLHFNVLKEIDTSTEQISFVKGIIDWCRHEKLVHTDFELDDSACLEIATSPPIKGHPLNMMLAIIRTLSQGWERKVSEADLKMLKPWEDLFYVDELLFAKDDLDWYFFLAMAHARTEIVRFTEVWWRLRLLAPEVAPEVAKLTDSLGRQGVLERLWLLGHLGRTIYTRPLGTDKAGFLEFFHANLRDYLVGTVMNYGGRQGLEGRRRGTPDAWRALDRLTAAARYWKQSQQLMLREDVNVLMAQKDVFVEPIVIVVDGQEKPVASFYLLFMRDNEDNRAEFFQSAKECFVYSALVHDILGRWAFRTLFPDITKQVELCEQWLYRSDRDSRIKILQYLVELRSEAHTALFKLVFHRDGADLDNVWLLLANILAEPLFAARYRSAFMIAALEHLLGDGIAFPDDNWHSHRFGEFCVAACNGSRNELTGLLKQMVNAVAPLQDVRLQEAMAKLVEAEALIERWIDSGTAGGIDITVTSRDIHGHVPPRIELRLGTELAKQVTDAMVEDWSRKLWAEVGLPLPRVEVSTGEVAGQDPDGEGRARDGFLASLLIDGRVIGVGEFYPGLVETLRRHWQLAGLSVPERAFSGHNEATRECVIWLPQSELDALGWHRRSVTFEESMQLWLSELLRQNVADVFTMQDMMPLLERTLGSGDGRLSVNELMGAMSGNYRGLWQVLVNLAREHVPPEPRLAVLLSELLDLLWQIKRTDPDLWTQRLRESVRHEICRLFVDETSQLPVMLLETAVEDGLIARLRVTERRRNFTLAPEDALRLTAAVSGHFETVLRNYDAKPVLVCDPEIRLPLFRMIQRVDSRVHVLGYTELSEEVRLRSYDVVTGITLTAGAARG